ncbi:5950_t:CDS:2, partial [Cetraspora pellucida]
VKVYSGLPYVNPEVLDENLYTTTSDIYSFGIHNNVGNLVWDNYIYVHRSSEVNLQLQICNDLQPSVNKEAPQFYVNLMKECWDKDPKNTISRKTLIIPECVSGNFAGGVPYNRFKPWQYNENILLELNESEAVIENIEESYENMFRGG